MSEKIVQLNKEVIKGQLKELVRGSVEETLNELLEQEALIEMYLAGVSVRWVESSSKLCGGPRCLPPPSASLIRRPMFTLKIGATVPYRAQMSVCLRGWYLSAPKLGRGV